MYVRTECEFFVHIVAGILKLSNAKVKLTRDLELLQAEYQHLKDQEETKRDILQKKLEEKSEEVVSLHGDLSSVKRDLENAQQAVDQVSTWAIN